MMWRLHRLMNLHQLLIDLSIMLLQSLDLVLDIEENLVTLVVVCGLSCCVGAVFFLVFFEKICEDINRFSSTMIP
jgi:hypothetical protein